MENTENVVSIQPETDAPPRVRWGIKVRCVPEGHRYEVNLVLPMGEEDNLPNLLEPSVIQALPEIMRALANGRLPGNEIDLANMKKQ